MLGNLRHWTKGVAVAGSMLALVMICTLCDRLAAREPPTPAAPLLASGETIVGERIVYPAGAPAKITAAIVTLAPSSM
jgi:hypothetical protein